MASKWKGLRGKLDAWKPESSFQEKVDAAKVFYANLSQVELARQFRQQKEMEDSLDLQDKLNNIEIEALSQLIVATLESSDVESIELTSGMKCSLETTPYVSVLDTPEARAAYDKWLNKTAIRKLKTLNTRTRDGFVGEILTQCMQQGKPIPTAILGWAKVHLKTKAKLTGRGKENSKEESNESQ